MNKECARTCNALSKAGTYLGFCKKANIFNVYYICFTALANISYTANYNKKHIRYNKTDYELTKYEKITLLNNREICTTTAFDYSDAKCSAHCT